MTKEIRVLEELGEAINSRNPQEILYFLGEGKERTELLITYIDGGSRASTRVASSPLIRLYEERGDLLMDIHDSDQNSDSYSYEGLSPRSIVFESPIHPLHELGDLVVGLDESGSKKLAISQYSRHE